MGQTLVVSTTDFCKAVRNEILRGNGIIPLLGAGLSAASGIPTRPDLMLYLKLCLTKVLGLRELTNPGWTPWRPQFGGWPTMEGDWRNHVDEGMKVLKEIIALSPNDATEKYQRFLDHCVEAFGSLVDWRLALQFLARIRIRDEPDKPFAAFFSSEDAPLSERPHTSFETGLRDHANRAYRISLGDVDEHVIDSFFNHIVAGKSPSMGHNMIVNLVQPLRVPIILTVNFDDLLEQAFRHFDSSLSVFNVHHEAGLPPWNLIGRQVALVKLHGSRYGLRADFSLDRAPTDNDKLHFQCYLAGQAITNDAELPDNVSKPNARYHLLIAGVSGQDRRVRILLHDALKRINHLKVFWCCYSDGDVRELNEHFREYGPQVVGVRHVHLGLLLWEIYETVTYCLPSRGLEFPTTWRMSAPPSLVPDEERTLLEHVKTYAEHANKWLQDSRRGPGLLIECGHSQDSSGAKSMTLSGISALAWQLFKNWNGPNKCIWIDCEDIGTVEQFKDYLLQAIAYRIGVDQPKPDISSFVEDKRHSLFFAEIRELLRTSARPWILFLNLRGSPAYCADSFVRLSLPDRLPSMDTAAWIKQRRSQWEWKPDVRRSMVDFINILAKSISKEVATVVLREEGTFALNKRLFPTEIRVTQLSSPAFQNWASTRAGEAIQWAKSGDDEARRRRRVRLLRAITLWQQVRHHTALVSRAVLELRCEEEEWTRAWEDTLESVNRLVELKVLRHKAGGFLWMHWEIREHLRELLITDRELEVYLKDTASLHLGAADWHMSFFHATGDPRAVFQAVYHRCWIAKLALESPADESNFVGARGALYQASSHLEVARGQILAQGHHHDTRACLRGYIKFLAKEFLSELEKYGNCQDPAISDGHERNVRLLLLLKVKAQLYRVVFERDVGRSDEVISAINHLRSWFTKWNTMPAKPKSSNKQLKTILDLYLDTWQDEAFWTTHVVELEWSIVCISMRDYRSALDHLSQIADKFQFPVRKLLKAVRDDQVWKLIDAWVEESGYVKNYGTYRFRYSIRRLMFCVLRRYMETLLLMVERSQVLREVGLENDRVKNEKALLRSAQMCYLAAQMLPRYIPQQESSLMRIERSRLHSVMAGTLALLGERDAVNRQVNEAVIALDNLSESERSIARAVLDLRLIYCRLAELRSISGHKALMVDQTNGARSDGSANSGSDVPNVEATLEEIDTLLNKVEGRMVGSRKSLWWWLTMCRYRMVWIEYSIFISLRNQGPQKAASSKVQELLESADRLMKDACLRSNSDSFQLARTLLAYCNILRLKAGFLDAPASRGLAFAVKRLRDVRCVHRLACHRSGIYRPSWLKDFVENVLRSAKQFVVSNP